MQITIEQSGNAGRYLGRLEGIAEAAEIVFSRAESGCLQAEHTFVPDAMRGSGAGLKLIERIVEDARRGGYRVLALCAYVRAQAKRHAEWSDVLDQPPA